jgi:hypothetical protein
MHRKMVLCRLSKRGLASIHSFGIITAIIAVITTINAERAMIMA